MNRFTTSLVCIALFLSSSLLASPEKWLIIGGTRGAGYALAQELASSIKENKDLSCTLFVNDAKKAKRFFGETSPLNIVEGQAAKDIQKLEKAAKSAHYIVVATTFPYKIWEKSIRSMIDNCLTVAHNEGSTLIYLGRIYKFGTQKTITETSNALPKTHQGKVLKEIEQQLEDAAKNNLVKTRIISHSYPFGPNVGDGLLDKNFRSMLTRSFFGNNGKFEWIGSGDVSMQLTYTPDLVRFVYEYAHKKELAPLNFHRINFKGTDVASIEELGKKYAEKAGILEDYNLSTYTRSGLTLASWVQPEATRAKDVFDFFETACLLDGSLFDSLFTDFRVTPLDTAVEETYQWYSNHKQHA